MEWISVEDRLPCRYDRVLVCSDGYVGESVYFGEFRCTETKWNINFCDVRNPRENYKNVTHWMPLPEPPKDFNKI